MHDVPASGITHRRRSTARDANPCPACGCERRTSAYESGGFAYAACPGCGLAHLDPLPTDAEARARFDDDYFNGGVAGGYDDYQADELLHRQNARQRLELVETGREGRRGRLLDVGCAFGFLLDEGRTRGWTVEGVEVADGVARAARERYHLEIAPDLEQLVGSHPAAYDVVTLYSVLAHVARPEQVLALAARALRPGGTLVVEAWDRRSAVARVMGRHWQEIAPPSVIWLFDRVSLPLLVERAGFSEIGLAPATKLVSVRFVASLLRASGRAAPIAALGRAIDRTPLRDRVVGYRLGDLVTLTARRSSHRPDEWGAQRAE